MVWVCGGGGLPEWTWCRWQIPSFPGYRHTVFHNRGIGETICSEPGPWTIADFARDTALVIEADLRRPGDRGRQVDGRDDHDPTRARPSRARRARRSDGHGGQELRVDPRLHASRDRVPQTGRIAERAVRRLPLRRDAQPRRRTRRRDSWERAEGAVRTVRRGSEDNQNERSLELQWDALRHVRLPRPTAACTVPLHVVGFRAGCPGTAATTARRSPSSRPRACFTSSAGHGHASLWGPMRSGEVNDLLREIFSGHDG